MALVLADRVKETSTSTGTGTIVLAGAATGFQSFAVIGNANLTYYTIADQVGANWEVGVGTYYTGNVSLARTTILSSSNAGAVANFTAGTKDVFVTQPSEVTAIGGGNQAILVNQSTATANYTLTANCNGFSVGPITVANGVSITVSSGSRWVTI